MREARCQVCRRIGARDAQNAKTSRRVEATRPPSLKVLSRWPVKRGDNDACGTLPSVQAPCRFANQNCAPLGNLPMVIEAVTDCSSLNELTTASRKYSRAPAKHDHTLAQGIIMVAGETDRQRCVRHDAKCAGSLLPVMRGKAKTSRRAVNQPNC
jgi:hypothetical protein